MYLTRVDSLTILDIQLSVLTCMFLICLWLWVCFCVLYFYGPCCLKINDLTLIWFDIIDKSCKSSLMSEDHPRSWTYQRIYTYYSGNFDCPGYICRPGVVGISHPGRVTRSNLSLKSDQYPSSNHVVLMLFVYQLCTQSVHFLPECWSFVQHTTFAPTFTNVWAWEAPW